MRYLLDTNIFIYWVTDFESLNADISKEHMLTYSRLRPDLQHGHKDPSDHIIIAHAITENSRNGCFLHYVQQTRWAI